MYFKLRSPKKEIDDFWRMQKYNVLLTYMQLREIYGAKKPKQLGLR